MARRAVGRGMQLRSRSARRGCPSPRMETKPIMKRVFVLSSSEPGGGGLCTVTLGSFEAGLTLRLAQLL